VDKDVVAAAGPRDRPLLQALSARLSEHASWDHVGVVDLGPVEYPDRLRDPAVTVK
jgi:hypothetical protein